jgi:sulfatase maturation enzyme AslB (radical SAM superfamily)
MKIFDLELVSPCNATCDFCPQSFRGVKRKRPFMDVDLLDRITAEIGEMALDEERVQVSICGMGENLLRKPLVLRALDNLQRRSNDRIETLLVTNGSKLTADLLEHEAFRKLSAIQVSFTGVGKESYEAIFGLKFEAVVENVATMKQKFPGNIYIRTVDLKKLQPRKEEFVSFWKDKGLGISFSSLHSRGGHITDPEAYPGRIRQFAGCEIFDMVTFVSSDGEVLSCCHDVTSAHVIGDCHVSTLAEIVAKKREMQAARFPGFTICSKCTDFTLSSSGRVIDRSQTREGGAVATATYTSP